MALAATNGSNRVGKAGQKPARGLVVLEARVVCGTGGGPDKTILNSPRFLCSAGYRTFCAYMHPPGDAGFEELRKKAQEWQAPLASIADRGPWDWQVFWKMLHLCRRERVAIWHGHDYKSNALGLLLRRFWPMRLVTTVHGWVKETRRTPLYYWVDRKCLTRYEAVICVSEDLHDRCLALGVPAERCVLIENAIDTREFTPGRSVAEAKRQLGFPPERQLIGAIGRLSAEKGFEVLIRSVDDLLKQGVDVELWISGEGDQAAFLQGLVAQLGRQDRIKFLGYRADTRRLYEAMDIFALSSYREGLPNVLLEAMAMGVPVVATRVAGIPRLIRAGENGLLVTPGNGGELTGALARLLNDAPLRTRLKQAGRDTIEAAYSFPARMEKIRLLYDALLETVSRPL
jgi:glycosyltransferase involved in cell wall biosynthesis